MSIGDLVRTSLSPDPDPGGIPYYTQTIGVNWSTTAAATTVGATLAYQDTQLDATRADRWTLDVGASRAISDWARVAAATHFFSRFAANDPAQDLYAGAELRVWHGDRKSTRLNSSHTVISYAVFCLKKKNKSHSKLCRPLRSNSFQCTLECILLQRRVKIVGLERQRRGTQGTYSHRTRSRRDQKSAV